MSDQGDDASNERCGKERFDVGMGRGSDCSVRRQWRKSRASGTRSHGLTLGH